MVPQKKHHIDNIENIISEGIIKTNDPKVISKDPVVTHSSYLLGSYWHLETVSEADVVAEVEEIGDGGESKDDILEKIYLLEDINEDRKEYESSYSEDMKVNMIFFNWGKKIWRRERIRCWYCYKDIFFS